MITKRVIPCLDIYNGRVFKGVNFLNLNDVGDPVELASFYNNSGADELAVLDIKASQQNRLSLIETVNAISCKCFIPLLVGGGVKNIDNIRQLMLNGADKVSINSAAIANPDLIKMASRAYGSQAIVVAIDTKKILNQKSELDDSLMQETIKVYHPDIKQCLIDHHSRWELFTHGGKNRTYIDAEKYIELSCSNGAGELLVTSMDHDGVKKGFDIELLSKIRNKVNVPIIASGGAGNKQHFIDVIEQAQVDAVLAASLFHYGELNINNLKLHMKSKNINMRIE